MAFGVGIVSAVVLSKKNPNYKTRLQKLQKKLQTKPPKSFVLYQVPIKQIFQVLLLIGFILVLKYFEKQYIIQQTEFIQNVTKGQNHLNSSKLLFYQHSQQYFYQTEFIYQDLQAQRLTIHQKQKVLKIQRVINIFVFLKILYIIGLLTWKQTNIKIIKIFPQVIIIDKYALLSWRHRKRIKILKSERFQTTEIITQEDDQYNPENSQKQQTTYQRQVSIRIFQVGENRFTNTNYQYHVILQTIFKKNDSIIQRQKEIIIKRGDIFHARKALIQICAVLKIKPNLKIRKNNFTNFK